MASRVNIIQPYLIHKYNLGMGGVDRLDRDVSDYRINIRSKKWWWPLFTFILDATIHNSWLLYKASAANIHSPLDHLSFRRELVKAYLQRYQAVRPAQSLAAASGPRRSLDNQVSPDVRFDGVGHYVRTRETQRRCRVCKMKTVKFCAKCTAPVHERCFEIFHSA